MPFISTSIYDKRIGSIYIHIYISARLSFIICICILRFRPASTKMILSLRVLNRRLYLNRELSPPGVGQRTRVISLCYAPL